MNKKKENILMASITVEASYIVPIIIGIIFAVMTISFYFYDLVTAQAILDKNAEKLKNSLIHAYEKNTYFYNYSDINNHNLYFSEDNSWLEEEGFKQIKKEMSSALIFLFVENMNITLKNKKITISAELSFNRKLLFGIQYIPFWGKIKKMKSEITVYYPADFARILELLH